MSALGYVLVMITSCKQLSFFEVVSSDHVTVDNCSFRLLIFVNRLVDELNL